MRPGVFVTCRQRSHFLADVQLPPAVSVPISSNGSSPPLLAHSGPGSWSPEVSDLASGHSPAVSRYPTTTLAGLSPANTPHIMQIWVWHLFPAEPDASPPPPPPHLFQGFMALLWNRTSRPCQVKRRWPRRRGCKTTKSFIRGLQD